ncbi:MAG: hypothetical protein ABIQ30_10190 [Devosia sp.]
MKYVVQTAPRRKAPRSSECDDGLTIPCISESVLDIARLTSGGAEIYRRVRRPASTCNLIATIAGIGGTMEAR